ncbi:MAG: PilN domain-containing protein [Pyrinomonadaceae bacterium]|nr:PilN domain-containing protein [Pyrinomonadaceae bacterium]
MIKINLLDSVTERQSGAVVAVERKIGSPVSRLVVMSIAVLFFLLAVVGWDIISTQMAKKEADRKLEEQKQQQVELAVVLKEQKDLEQKIQNIDARIEAIKKLRATQAGPSAVLDAMVERISMFQGLYLESIEQTGSEIVLKGSSPDDSAVIQFGRSLEFSGGLFTNLNIETERREIQVREVSETNTDPNAGMIHIVGFTIKCAYTPEKANAPKDATTAENKQPEGAPQNTAVKAPQIAKN